MKKQEIRIRVKRWLSWTLCAAMVLGNLCASEGVGMTALAAEVAEPVESRAYQEDSYMENDLNISEEIEQLNPANVYADVSSGEYIASGSYENVTWTIDADGKLTVEGTGEFVAKNDADGKLLNCERVPWRDNAKDILSAQVQVEGMKDA